MVENKNKFNEEYKEEIRRKAELLKAIAHPVRLCLTKNLYKHGKCNVTYFTDCMDTSQSNISQHLAKMRDIGILGCEKEGKNVNYYIKNDEVKEIISILFEDEGGD